MCGYFQETTNLAHSRRKYKVTSHSNTDCKHCKDWKLSILVAGYMHIGVDMEVVFNYISMQVWEHGQESICMTEGAFSHISTVLGIPLVLLSLLTVSDPIMDWPWFTWDWDSSSRRGPSPALSAKVAELLIDGKVSCVHPLHG